MYQHTQQQYRHGDPPSPSTRTPYPPSMQYQTRPQPTSPTQPRQTPPLVGHSTMSTSPRPDRAASTFYDPTSEHRHRVWTQGQSSPDQTRQSLNASGDRRDQSSPTRYQQSASPKTLAVSNTLNMGPPPPERPTTSSRVDPMSFSNILASSTPTVPRRASLDATHETETAKLEPAAPPRETIRNDVSEKKTNGIIATKPKIISEKALRAAIIKLESLEDSDVDMPGFEAEYQQYQDKSRKRAREVDDTERASRKRRQITHLTKLTKNFTKSAEAARERYMASHERLAQEEIREAEIVEEKERKKIQQRNRRWETRLNKAQQAIDEIEGKITEADDPAEVERLSREKQRAEKKVASHRKFLYEPNEEASPAPDPEVSQPVEVQESVKKKRPNGRLKKSKEQKQAEKDTAAAAHAAMERDELAVIAPKDKEKKKEEKAPSSKAYDTMFESIWRDLARKDVPKVWRIKNTSSDTRAANLRKTAILASKEARRWQVKTNRSTKDTQARAKRVMREMLSFWKRNERDERDQRKLAERAELEAARQAEKEREDNRQKRKLNFLISQTELYSHFIGKKVKTDEIERATDSDGVTPSGQTVRPAPQTAHSIELPGTGVKPGAKVTNFEDLDFDNDDESALHAAAMANAQNAVQEAQDRARAFNNQEGALQSQFDDGEMNFQNPTSLQSMDITQPKMLSCQLKEYQLKGLNWLVNLYEQGINGILADEMGLGKTVQSISVMAYLAERHNIWGPFLVIAPASTLHNWQQEIVKFVPTLKVLPYWGNAKDRKVLRKYWDRKHITYEKTSPFHVLVTSYQLVVQDAQYFQKVRWQYMILDEAQAIKSAQSSRWKSLLGFHCRNRLLLTGTPIQNNMQELWALLHFIMPSLFDSHDEFSEWFSKDIESHAQSNTRLNEDQLKRLHMILKPFMLRRIKKHVQKELGDKIEEDVFCDLTYRQRAYYSNLRNKISIMDLIEKAAIGDDQDTATLMNLVMQFRKVCNHPDLFERADVSSPVSFGYFAETASFLREGHEVLVGYSTRNWIELKLPRRVAREGRLDLPGPDNQAGWRKKLLFHDLSIFSTENIRARSAGQNGFSWLRFANASPGMVSRIARNDLFHRTMENEGLDSASASIDETDLWSTPQRLFNIVSQAEAKRDAANLGSGVMGKLFNIAATDFADRGVAAIEPCARPAVSAPPVELYSANQHTLLERQRTFFNTDIRTVLYGITEQEESKMLEKGFVPPIHPPRKLLPEPVSAKARYTRIQVPSMRRFVTDSGKLAMLDRLLAQLKEGGHRVLLYFQMTRMIDLMEEYLTYRNYKYCRLDGSTKLEDRRDTVADFQSRPEIFVFLLSTRAGGLGINLTAADTVIFYDSDWNPTIDSQAMDRAHRLGQTRQVTVYRMITRGTIEERIRRRALQKEEVQRVVISGGAGATVDFNTKRDNRTKDIAMWLADDDQAAEIEKKEAEIAAQEAKDGPKKNKKATKRRADVSMDDLYHEGVLRSCTKLTLGEGHFDDGNKPSGTATPAEDSSAPAKKRKGFSKKAKSVKEKLAYIDGE